MCISMYIYQCICISMYIHLSIYIYRYADIHIRRFSCITCTHVLWRVFLCAHIRLMNSVHIRIHAQTYTHTYTEIHCMMHAHTHTHTLIHTATNNRVAKPCKRAPPSKCPHRARVEDVATYVFFFVPMIIIFLQIMYSSWSMRIVKLRLKMLTQGTRGRCGYIRFVVLAVACFI